MNQNQRMTKLRLAWFNHLKTKSQNVAKTCRYFGISRYTYYFWWKRYQKEGIKGLREHSRKPQNSPRATSQEIVKKITRLRKNLKIGPTKLSRHLAKYYKLIISPKTIYLILKRKGLNKNI